MLRNVKPKVHELDINQMNKLNELNFCVSTILSGNREIKQSDTYFAKNYNCCGGSF